LSQSQTHSTGEVAELKEKLNVQTAKLHDTQTKLATLRQKAFRVCESNEISGS
jgi:hypothetical protein